jgi:hypothetical protein
MCAGQLQEIYCAQQFSDEFDVTDWLLAHSETCPALLRFLFQTH